MPRTTCSALFGLWLAAVAGCAPRGAAAVRSASPAVAPGAAVDLVIAATTDVHGRLRGWDYYGGRPDPAHSLASEATIVDSLRRAAPGRVLLVDAGDVLQGNPLTALAARAPAGTPHPVIAAMNAMHYDAAVVGNHEFNYGLPFLRRAVAQARFPFLAANARTPSGRRAFPGWRMFERAGVPIAVVGATTPGSNAWDRANLSGRVVIGDIVPAVRAAVDSARRAGAGVVVVVLHSGLDEPSSYDTVATGLPSENVAARVAKEVPGIDLLVYGHSHKQIADTVVGGVLLMQPKNFGTNLGVARLRVVRQGARWRVAAKSSRLIPAAGHSPAAAVLAATRGAHEATLRYVGAVIGSTPVTWRSDSGRVTATPLVDFVLDVERQAAGTQLASTSVFDLGARIDSGPITIAEVARIYPYENTLDAIRITGRQLRAYLEYSARYYNTLGSGHPIVDFRVPGYDFDIVGGVDYTLDLSRPVGARVTGLTYRGRPVADADTFTMAVNNYRQSGGGGYAMLRDAPVLHHGQTEIRQLLIRAVEQRRVLLPPLGDSSRSHWRLRPRAARDSAYAAMNRPPHRRVRYRATSIASAPVPALASATARVATAPTASASTSTLRVISTNDFHGALEPQVTGRGTPHGGAVAMAAAVERAEAGCRAPCVSLLVDGGDMFQGSAESNLAFGRPVVALYEKMGYAASALGNHEFDWGLDTLRARMRDARYDILGANVRDTLGRDIPWIRDDTIVDRGPFRIGLIGIIGPETYGSIMARNVASVRFADPAPIIDSLDRALRARGADVVIVIAHSGAFCEEHGTQECHGEIFDLARRLTQPVDMIVSAHTHTVVDAAANGIPIVQAASSGRDVAVVDLRPVGAGRPATVIRQRVEPVPAAPPSADPAVAALVARAAARVADVVNAPVARLATDLERDGEQYPLGNLIADAQRVEGGADVAFVNNGGIRTGLPAGTVTYGELFEVQPFGNVLDRLTVSGATLRAYVERLLDYGAPRDHVSGLHVVYDTTRAAGDRIVRLTGANGAPVRDGSTYRVVLNDYMATGGPGLVLMRNAHRVERLDTTDLDALITYLRARSQPVVAPAAVRFQETER